MPRINTPLVSILLPYYNDEKFLRQCIESILNNDYQNFELILLNHATQDSSRDIAHSYNDTRIKHIDMDINYGGGGGLLFEKMLSVANGKYIKPFCADDVLKKDGLKILVEYMESNPNKDFAFGDVEYVDEEGRDLCDSWFKNRPNFSLKNDEIDCLRLFIGYKGFLPYISSILKKSILSNLYIEKTFFMMFDMSLWFNCLLKGYKIGFIDKIVAYYRSHKEQASSTTKAKISSLYCYFESVCFNQNVFNINISLAKQIFSGWGDDKFDDIIQDTQDLDFYIAYKLFAKQKDIYAYLQLNKMLNNELKRKRIEEVFGYTIKNFREDIINNTNKRYKKSSLKRKIYDKSVKDLNLFDLCFLVGRQIFSIITLFKLRHKNKKSYSL